MSEVNYMREELRQLQDWVSMYRELLEITRKQLQEKTEHFDQSNTRIKQLKELLDAHGIKES